MIYILAGTDTKKRSAHAQTLAKGHDSIRLPESEITKERIMQYASGVSLFGDTQAIIIDGLIKDAEIVFSDNDLSKMQDSQTVFILLEDKLLVGPEKKYKKYAEEIVRFEEKKIAKAPAVNTFAIADAYGAHDKVRAWVLYREAVDRGVEPEPISGILFWKIKTLLLTGTKAFTKDALKKSSADLVSLYHRAHRGERDFVVGLEQFILSSLSK